MNPSTLLPLTLVLLCHDMVRGDVTQLTSAASTFSQRLYQEITVDLENVIYSPFSIHSCLSLASLGARGTTAMEMTDVLGLTSLTDPHGDYQDLITSTNNVTDVELYTTNAFFINPAFSIKTTYQTEAETFYHATIDDIDFSSPEGPEQAINDYVSDNTNGLIESILPQDIITGDTVLILVNTVFFNGTWQKTFSESATIQQDFFKLDGNIIQVDMMRDIRNARIKRNVHRADVAELLFKDPRFALYIVLPRLRGGLPKLERRLARCGGVDDFFTGLESSYVSLSIPKFKIESAFELKPALVNLGIVKAFSDADFSGISDVSGLGVTGVAHKAVIEVKETGTVAAAVTAITFGITSVGFEPEPELFIADHPFLFYLRDNDTGNILFQGKFSG